MTHQSFKQWLFVEIKEGARNFGLVPCLHQDILYFDDKHGHDGTCEIPLPSGNYTIIGKGDAIDIATQVEIMGHFKEPDEFFSEFGMKKSTTLVLLNNEKDI